MGQWSSGTRSKQALAGQAEQSSAGSSEIKISLGFVCAQNDVALTVQPA